jgi:hypothetical protein
MRAAADRKKAERELHSRRQAVATEHREAAAQRESRAEQAEQKARLAQQSAERERAEANLEKEHASMHERGLADDELIDDHERDRFAAVSGTDPTRDGDLDRDAGTTTRDGVVDRDPGTTTRDGVVDRDTGTTTRDVDGDGHTLDDRTRAATDRDDATATTPADTTSPDYDRGREDERFERDDVRESDRPRTS